MLDQALSPADPAVALAPEVRTLPELFLRRAERTPSDTAWKSKRGGAWVATSYGEFYRSAAAVATFLIDHGVRPGDKLCIVGGTRPEWCISDIGGLLAGAVTVGAYTTLAPAQLAFILDHSDSRIAIAEGNAEVEKILEKKHELGKLELVLVWNTQGLDEALRTHPWIVPFEQALGTKIDRARIDAHVAEVKAGEAAIIVYTSGTTGPPKGAMISHENILTLLDDTGRIRPVDRSDEGVSFLPMAHVAERVMSFYGRINAGLSTAFATSVPAVLEEVKEVRPTMFGSVPRIFEKAYARIMSEVGKAPPARQKIFRWAESVGLQVVADWQAGRESSLGLRIQHKVADRLVFSKIRQAFGGRVKYFVTGAAPIPKPILEFFWGAGMPIFEVYGMTEATVLTHANSPGAVRLGSVGKPLPVIEDKLADDGEILIRGKTVFLGYYKNPEATAEAIDKDGWLHTGDIGKRDADGFLYIADRKKHIIITAGGKNLTPANIENEIKASDSIISQVHVHGDRRPYCTALITIHPVDAIEWAIEQGLWTDAASAEAMRLALLQNPLAKPEGLSDLMNRVTSHPKLRSRIVEAVRKANAALSRVEAIKRVYLLDRELSLEEDEVTPTLKVKRRNLEKKFASVFDRLYEDPGFGLVVMGREE